MHYFYMNIGSCQKKRRKKRRRYYTTIRLKGCYVVEHRFNVKAIQFKLYSQSKKSLNPHVTQYISYVITCTKMKKTKC